MSNEVWYQGKAFSPSAAVQRIVEEFHGEDAIAKANAWFQARKYATGDDYCDAVYVYRIEGDWRSMVLSYSDTYGPDYNGEEDESDDWGYSLDGVTYE